MPDRNKSELTLRITEAAINWLDGIGCRPIETEIWVDDSWIADIAASWRPTMTEAQNMKLISRRPRIDYFGTEEKLQEQREKNESWYKKYEKLPRFFTVLHEVKVSRSDFTRDDKWTRKSPTNIRILSIPRGIIKEEEWPEGWWILEHAKTGKLLKAARKGMFTEVTLQKQLDVVQNVAERRHNRTKYAFFKEIQKSHTNSHNEYVNRVRLSSMAKAVFSILKAEHDSVETALRYYIGSGPGTTVPNYIMKELKQLYGKLKCD